MSIIVMSVTIAMHLEILYVHSKCSRVSGLYMYHILQTSTSVCPHLAKMVAPALTLSTLTRVRVQLATLVGTVRQVSHVHVY